MPTPTLQLLSRTLYDTDGVSTIWDFAFSGGYIANTHVKAYTETPLGLRTELTINPPTDLIGPYQLQITPALAAGNKLVIYRDTPKTSPLVDFTDESGFSEVALDTNAKQAVFIAAEAIDVVNTTDLSAAALAAATAGAAAAAAAVSQAAAAASVAAAAGQVTLASGYATAAEGYELQAAADALAAAASAAAAAAASANSVLLTGDQTVGGVKTFSFSPVLPGNATTALQAVPKQQFDLAVLTSEIGTVVQPFDAQTAFTDVQQNWTAPQTVTPVVDNDLTFSLAASLAQVCTPTAGGVLTYTNIPAGVIQSGAHFLNNTAAYAITPHANTKISAADLTAISATGMHLLGYKSYNGNVYVYLIRSF